METSHYVYNELALKHFHNFFINVVTKMLMYACRNIDMETYSLDYDLFQSRCNLLIDFLPWTIIEDNIVSDMCMTEGIELISICDEFLENYSESEIVRQDIFEALHSCMNRHKHSTS